ncbi:MAG: TetR/AcrR family transcriptional regulator [Fimbriimonas sp.]|nr:TetR/AcrR family transcriptional regulator [Fimbriimonas sp.]
MARTVSTRQQLIDTAVRLFSSNGFQRTSLDLIALESGVSKMTIFYYFKNKEDLVIAALEEAHQNCLASVRELAMAKSSDSKTYLSAVFGALEHLSTAGELPNLYIRALAEFTDEDSPIRQLITTHVRFVEKRFSTLAMESGFQDPEDVVRQLMTILRALYATQICPAGGTGSICAKKMADCVIKVSPAFAA